MRHGETYWNREGKIQGSADIELTEQGIEQAAAIRDAFAREGIRFRRIYTSPYVRAVKTAWMIAEKQDAPVLADRRIREMNFGKYEGGSLKYLSRTDENIANCFRVPSLYRPDDTGESFAEVYERVRDFLQNEILPLETDADTGCVLAVCHGAVIRAFLTQILNMELDEFWTIRQPNCCVNRIRVERGSFTSVETDLQFVRGESQMQSRACGSELDSPL